MPPLAGSRIRRGPGTRTAASAPDRPGSSSRRPGAHCAGPGSTSRVGLGSSSGSRVHSGPSSKPGGWRSSYTPIATTMGSDPFRVSSGDPRVPMWPLASAHNVSLTRSAGVPGWNSMIQPGSGVVWGTLLTRRRSTCSSSRVASSGSTSQRTIRSWRGGSRAPTAATRPGPIPSAASRSKSARPACVESGPPSDNTAEPPSFPDANRGRASPSGECSDHRARVTPAAWSCSIRSITGLELVSFTSSQETIRASTVRSRALPGGSM